ncbi:MAG: mechanosensitive ion channel domain-containing protein [Bacteroidota bacterium]
MKTVRTYVNDFLNLELFEFGDDYLTPSDLMVAILILIVTRFVWFGIRRVTTKTSLGQRIQADPGRRNAVLQLFKYIIYTIAIIAILNSLDVDTSLLITSTAALFVGIGLALQSTFMDVASGIIILFEGTIEVGDVIQIQSIGLEGKVKTIGLRSSIVETPDSVSIIVPNSKMTTSHVVNLSFNDKETRYVITVGVAYGSDVTKVKEVLLACALSNEKVLKTPAPTVRFSDFGTSSLDFELLVWSHQSFLIEDVKSALRFEIEKRFRTARIEIPFPQRDIHIKSGLERLQRGD